MVFAGDQCVPESTEQVGRGGVRMAVGGCEMQVRRDELAGGAFWVGKISEHRVCNSANAAYDIEEDAGHDEGVTFWPDLELHF